MRSVYALHILHAAKLVSTKENLIVKLVSLAVYLYGVSEASMCATNITPFFDYLSCNKIMIYSWQSWEDGAHSPLVRQFLAFSFSFQSLKVSASWKYESIRRYACFADFSC